MSSARYVVVACTQKDRWFDLDSERTALAQPTTKFNRDAETRKSTGNWHGFGPYDATESAGTPPLDCWLIDDDDPPPTTEKPPMSEARFIVGDVFEEMAKMPDNSVDLIVTSPPFLALRSYLPADHLDKHKEIGSEPTPAAFLTTLLALTREWRRILTPTGSLCVELGDTYAGSGGGGGDYLEGGLREGQPGFGGSAERQRDGNAAHWRQKNAQRPAWPLAKSLCLIPSLYAGSLAYGRNLLEPDEFIKPWRVRNLIVWHRPNPPVGALGDKVRPSTSYVTVACTQKDRWFDLDSERGPSTGQTRDYVGDKSVHLGKNLGPYTAAMAAAGAPPLDCWFEDRLAQSDEPIDAPDADVWTIPTAPYAGSHYATFPPALPRRLINLMCPRQVCTSCGEPRRRIVEHDGSEVDHGQRETPGRLSMHSRDRRLNPIVPKIIPTGDWSDCGHNTWRRGIVLDCFGGSGTTGAAAAELGRDSILIDLDARNLELARQRLGLFLVEEPATEPPPPVEHALPQTLDGAHADG